MKKSFLLIAVFIALAGLVHSQNASAASLPSPYEPEVLLAFADSLYNDGFLTQAEGEYKRFLFARPEIQPADMGLQSSLISLSNIYKSQNNVKGIEWLRENFYFAAASPVKERMNLVQADFIFQSRDAQAFSAFSSELLPERLELSMGFKDLIDASELLLNKDIGGLKAFCPGAAIRNPDFEELNKLCQSYKLKSPGLALFLSSIIPGSGKWYTGSFGAFTSSFLTIGTFIAGTVVTGIKGSWKTWQPYVFGSCGLVLYIAELYGSYQSAKRYNASLYRVLCEETEKLYEIEY